MKDYQVLATIMKVEIVNCRWKYWKYRMMQAGVALSKKFPKVNTSRKLKK